MQPLAAVNIREQPNDRNITEIGLHCVQWNSAIICKMQLQLSAKMVCNFLQKGLAKNTGDPTSDPWEWRIILSRDPSIAYGKFFNKSAGFVSKGFFPTFANYRRNGYDFDSLFEDELASYRAKKIMDRFRFAVI